MTVSCVPVTTCPHYDKENIINDDYEEPEEEADDDALPDYGEGVKFWLSAQMNDYGTAVVTDDFGGVFVTGFMQMQEGSSDTGRVFITKFNNSLDVLWTKFLSTTENERSSAIAVDSRGFVYVAGVTYGSIGGDFENQGDADLFLAKFNAEGEKVWARQWGSEEYDGISAISIDSEDNIYVAGSTTGELDDNMNLGGSDMFITKFNDSGTKQWTKQWGTDENDSAVSIKNDSEGNILLTGTTNGGLDGCEHSEVDPEYSTYTWDAFLTKLDKDGNRIWTRQWGGSTNNYMGISISIDTYGDIYVLESLNSSRIEMSITSFTSDGIQKYSKFLGPTIFTVASMMVCDKENNLLVNGFHHDGQSYVPFLSKFNKNAQQLWTKEWNPKLISNTRNNLSLDKYGNIFMTGSVREDMGPDGDRTDAFLIKVNAEDL